MAKFIFKMPDVGEGVAEAEVVEWHVKIGDRVEEDQHIVDVMTDKATIDIESPVSGVVTTLAGEVGDVVAIGAMLLVIETEGEGEATEAEADAAAEQIEDDMASNEFKKRRGPLCGWCRCFDCDHNSTPNKPQ